MLKYLTLKQHNEQRKKILLSVISLEGSLEDLPEEEDVGEVRGAAEGSHDHLDDPPAARPRLVTLWTTSYTTYTVISTSTNTDTTFSVSYMCSVAGASFPESCS